jgi:hypothetical protein
MVFIAGNERADQDPQFEIRSMAAEVAHQDVILHAIYCGNEQHDHADSWKDLSSEAQGHFATIDHRTVRALVETPYDEELAELGASLNETYVPLGKAGRQGRANQLTQDENAKALSVAAAASRAQTKASPLYSCDWDLIEAVEKGQVDLFDVPEADLPEIMRPMTTAERESYIAEMLLNREEIRQRIAELSEKRRRYVTDQAQAKGLDDSRAFDGVVRSAIREQLEERGFRPADEP